MKPILVTGATGKIGGAVAAELLAAGIPVRAVVHRLDARSEALRVRGAQISVADFADYDALVSAMTGIERAFYCPPLDPHVADSALAFTAAVAETGVRSLVVLSQWLANPASPALLTRTHWLIDRLFSRLPDVTLTIVNPGFFADNILRYTIATAAHLGQFPWPYGASLNAWPANEDIAAVAVAALRDPQRHDGRIYRPTGPALLSGDDIVQALSHVLNRTVRLMPISEQMFGKAVRAAGFPPYARIIMHAYNEEQRRGAFAYNAPTDHVRLVTGREPESFEATVRRYAAAPLVQPGARNFFAALVGLLKIVATPPPDLARYERSMQIPRLSKPRYSIDSERWLAEHAPGSDSTFVERRLATSDHASSRVAYARP